MELYQKVNEMVRQDKSFIVYNPFTDVPCLSNNDLCWAMFNTDKFLQFIDMLNTNNEWKKFMYKKTIPIDMLANYKDHLDWDYIQTYGLVTEDIIEKYADKMNWSIISMKKCSTNFLEKHIDKIDFDIIAIYQKLSPKFIDTYKDKLNWIDICMYQPMMPSFIEEHINYLTDPCWINISKYQMLDFDFIMEHADKLNWQIMSVYQNIAYSEILEKYDKEIDWDALSYYQPLSYEIIKKYKNSGKFNFDKLVENPGIHFTEEIVETLVADSLLNDHELYVMLDKMHMPCWLIEYCIKKYPDIIRWSPAEKIEGKCTACVSSSYKLTPEFMIKYKDKICWQAVNINNINGLPFSLIYEKRDEFGIGKWKEMSMRIAMPEDFIDNVLEYVDWYNITNYQELSEAFIDKHADKIDWETVFLHNKLSEEMIIRHKDKINWKRYIYMQPITDNLLINCVDDICLFDVIDMFNISNEVLIKMKNNCMNAMNIEVINEEIAKRKQKAYKEGYIIKEFEKPIIPLVPVETKSAANEIVKKENIFKRLFNKIFNK